VITDADLADVYEVYSKFGNRFEFTANVMQGVGTGIPDGINAP